MTTETGHFVALLRGINVGGRHAVPMAGLRTVFETDLRCTSVKTYIQSGNVVGVRPRAGLAEDRVARVLEERFGFPIPVAIRTRAEFDRLIAAAPFAAATECAHLVFLRSDPASELIAKLAAKIEGEERIVAGERALYLWLPHGVGRSKLALGVVAPGVPGNPTMRNWKTVLALRGLLAAG